MLKMFMLLTQSLVGDDVPHHSIYGVQMTMHTDVAVAKALSARLQSEGLPVTGIQGFSDNKPLPVS